MKLLGRTYLHLGRYEPPSVTSEQVPFRLLHRMDIGGQFKVNGRHAWKVDKADEALPFAAVE
jgi:hypothetical protein